MIHIIGLGNRPGDISLSGYRKVREGHFTIVKTNLSETFAFVGQEGIAHVTLDDIYRSSRSFDTLNRKLAAKVRAYEREHGEVCYLVDGSGYDDSSCRILLSGRGEVDVYPAAGKNAPLSGAGTGEQSIAAEDLLSLERLCFRRDMPLTVYELDTALTAGEVKLRLADFYGDEAAVTVSFHGKETRCMLAELDRFADYDYSFCVRVEPQELTGRTRYDFHDLLHILKVLRGENGCPWDKVQTHESIRLNAVEEAYELVEAIDLGDADKMREETGDVLLQAAFHCSLGEDAGEFTTDDVLSELCGKLIFRHSHIFGSDSAADADEALTTWEKNKRIEKGQDTVSRAILDIPKQFPALLRAQKVQKKASKAGFDFESAAQAMDKLREELDELSAAQTPEEREHEGGDLLFSAVNVLRLMGVDGETALITSIEKFIDRFRHVESAVLASGRTMQEVSPEEMNRIYDEYKASGRV